MWHFLRFFYFGLHLKKPRLTKEVPQSRCILKRSCEFDLIFLYTDQIVVSQKPVQGIFLLPAFHSWHFLPQISGLRNWLPKLLHVLLNHLLQLVYFLIRENLIVLLKHKTHPYQYVLFFDAPCSFTFYFF